MGLHLYKLLIKRGIKELKKNNKIMLRFVGQPVIFITVLADLLLSCKPNHFGFSLHIAGGFVGESTRASERGEDARSEFAARFRGFTARSRALPKKTAAQVY